MRKSLPVLLIFVLSGAAGLIYEVVWARQLVLVFGNTANSISAILTGFFGGMAIGSAVGGRISDRVARPLRMFAYLEMGVAMLVIVTPLSFRAIHEVYRGAFGVLESHHAMLTFVRFALALVALAPVTILMGATLPVLTRALTRRSGDLSIAFGRLYAANTIGGIIGTIAAGFILIELFGLSNTLRAGVACSATAGFIALVLSRAPQPETSELIDEADRSGAGTGSRPRIYLALTVAFISGLTSLGYQVVWTRLLASGTGNSTYVFSAILALFLIGLAAGALAFNWYRPRIDDPVSFVAHGQLVIALLVCLGMLTAISKHLGGFIAAGEHFGTLFLYFIAIVALVVLPATFVMGLTFPAAAALAADTTGRVGTNSGLVLAANTVGAIAGTIVIPFVIIPAVGSSRTIALLALCNIGLALALAVAGRIRTGLPRVVISVAGATAVFVIVGGLVTTTFFRDPTEAWIESNDGRVYESREDEIASVQAGEVNGRKQLWVTGTSMTSLTVDASLMPMLPLMLRPKSGKILTVAFGMGSSHRMALTAGLYADVVELVPSVVKMFRWFFADADAVLENPDGRVIVSDGRNYVGLTRNTYDIIVTDPPPPIESSGVSVIASREYYEQANNRLILGGVMMQWVPLGQSLDEFRAHVRTFHSVFPHVILADGPGGHGMFMLGSQDPIALDAANVRAVLARPGVVRNLSSSFDSPAKDADGWGTLIPKLVWMEGAAIDAFVGDGPLITDDRPLPEYFLLRHLSGIRSGTKMRVEIGPSHFGQFGKSTETGRPIDDQR